VPILWVQRRQLSQYVMLRMNQELPDQVAGLRLSVDPTHPHVRPNVSQDMNGLRSLIVRAC